MSGVPRAHFPNFGYWPRRGARWGLFFNGAGAPGGPSYLKKGPGAATPTGGFSKIGGAERAITPYAPNRSGHREHSPKPPPFLGPSELRRTKNSQNLYLSSADVRKIGHFFCRKLENVIEWVGHTLEQCAQKMHLWYPIFAPKMGNFCQK